MTVAPRSGESGMKMINGDPKRWYWCPKHESWVRHTPQDCKGKGFNPRNPGKTEDKETKDTTKKESLMVSKALTALMEADDEE